MTSLQSSAKYRQVQQHNAGCTNGIAGTATVQWWYALNVDLRWEWCATCSCWTLADTSRNGNYHCSCPPLSCCSRPSDTPAHKNIQPLMHNWSMGLPEYEINTIQCQGDGWL